MKHSEPLLMSILIASALFLSAARNGNALPSSEKSEQTTNGHNQTVGSKVQDTPQSRPSVTLLIKEIPASELKQITAAIQQQAYKHWWNAPNAPEWALFFLTVPYVLVSIWLLLVTRRQAQLTREALITDKRAFIYADAFMQYHEQDPATGLYNWRFRPRWRNAGEGATRNATMYVQCEMRNSPSQLGIISL
jgi:hypothetical protein